jgi:hypothetical protein
VTGVPLLRFRFRFRLCGGAVPGVWTESLLREISVRPTIGYAHARGARAPKPTKKDRVFLLFCKRATQSTSPGGLDLDTESSLRLSEATGTTVFVQAPCDLTWTEFTKSLGIMVC